MVLESKSPLIMGSPVMQETPTRMVWGNNFLRRGMVLGRLILGRSLTWKPACLRVAEMANRPRLNGSSCG